MSFVVLIFIMMPLNILGIENHYNIDAVMDRNVELPCNVTAEEEGAKLSILAWYGNGSSEAFYSSRDLRADDNDSVISPFSSSEGLPERYTLISQVDEGTVKLLISSVRPGDAGHYRCRADFNSSPSLNTYIQLNVIEPPQRLWVIYNNGTHVATTTAGSNNVSENIGPYYIGDSVLLHCVAFGKPVANVTWWAAYKKFKDTATPLSDHHIRSDLSYGPLRREDHGLVLSCTANNNNVTMPLAIDAIVNMYLPPELVSIRDLKAGTDGTTSAGHVQAGEEMQLQCRVLGARPTPNITWRLNDEELVLNQTITKEPSQRLVTSDVGLTITAAHDEGRVTCCAPSHQGKTPGVTCSGTMHLTVTYPPVLKILVESEIVNYSLTAVKGSDVILNCSHQANPPISEVYWIHKDDIIPSDSENELPMHPLLNIYNVSESDAGEYRCAASNHIDNDPSETTAYSEPILLDVTYPPSCEDPSVTEYGVDEGLWINITCNMKSNPEPEQYRWVLVDKKIEIQNFNFNSPHTARDTEDATIEFQRPDGSTFNTIFCWGLNGVTQADLPHFPCTFLVTDKTVPHPPTECKAEQTSQHITIECEKGHDGGLTQEFKLSVNAKDSEDYEIMRFVQPEPQFEIQQPKEENYKFVIVAYNKKGESKPVEIDKESIVQEILVVEKSAVPNITTLALSLCGGVLLLVVAACGLALCSLERAHSPAPDPPPPPLCAYNTDESQCETYQGSEDGSDCNVRRTESFRRALQRYPSALDARGLDARRAGSFRAARLDADPPHACRVHSMQNLSRKREMEAACDHLIMHLPPEPNYHVAKPMNTFYTMPRKTRNKSFSKQIRDDASEITQNSDQFSLPPPPDELGTYRAAGRIRDFPATPAPTYTTIKKSPNPLSKHNNDSIISPMNTVGLPTISGTQTIYSYPDDHGERSKIGFITFQSFSSRKESGI